MRSYQARFGSGVAAANCVEGGPLVPAWERVQALLGLR